MTEEEYTAKLKAIEADYNEAKKQLYISYALGNAKYKVGDIIKDHRWVIKIDRITTYKGFDLPCAVYKGYELKKDLTPKKSNDYQSIYGEDGVELIKSAE